MAVNGIDHAPRIERIERLEDGYANLRVDVARLEERVDQGFERVGERLEDIDSNLSKLAEVVGPMKAAAKVSEARRALLFKLLPIFTTVLGVALKVMFDHFTK